MPVVNWTITGPDNVSWTPAEVAQIVRAAQAFQAALPNETGKLSHFTSLAGIGVLGANYVVDWPQPGDEDE